MKESENFKKLVKKDFEAGILSGKKTSVLIFGTEYSGSAAMMNSMLKRVSREFTSSVNFYKVDLIKQSKISKFYKVKTAPTLLIIKENKVVESLLGFTSANEVRKIIRSLVDQNSQTSSNP